MIRKIMISLLAIAVVAVLIGLGTMAWFTDTTKNTIETTNAEVKIGVRTGFPLQFENLTPCVWTGWKQVTLANASTIPMDVYIGLQDKGLGGVNLQNLLHVQIQRWEAGAWVMKYNGDVSGLFAAWQKMADDMAKDTTDTYQIRVHLSADAENDLQGGLTKAWVLIHGVQYNGPAPTSTPWNVTLP